MYSENRGIRGRFSSTAHQRLDESRYAVKRISRVLGLSSVKISGQFIRQQQQQDETDMPPHMKPKTPPGVSKNLWDQKRIMDTDATRSATMKGSG